ncbi:MAG: transposase [Desulfobulbaceae bacterium]|nr:transposase [Desulfobulbaceae bacterium]
MSMTPAPRNHALRVGRHSGPGLAYLVTTVTADRVPLFGDFGNGRIVVRELARLDSEGMVQSLAFVVMPDHLHWLFVLGETLPLSKVMQYLKGRSAHFLNLDEVAKTRCHVRSTT